MPDLMCGNVNLRFVANNNGRGSKCQQGVLHATNGETGWLHYQSVCAPLIWVGRVHVSLNVIEELVKFIQLTEVSFHIVWLRNDEGAVALAYRVLNDVADREGY